MKEANFYEIAKQLMDENDYDKAALYLGDAVAADPLCAKFYALLYELNTGLLKKANISDDSLLRLLLELALSLDPSFSERNLLEKKLEEKYQKSYSFIWNRLDVVNENTMQGLYLSLTRNIADDSYGDNWSDYEARGYIHLCRGEFQKALDDFKGLERQNIRKFSGTVSGPDRSKGLALIADSYFFLKDYENAEKMYYKYLSNVGDRHSVSEQVIKRSLCCYRLKKYDLAREALSFNPNAARFPEFGKQKIIEFLEKIIDQKVLRLKQFKQQESSLRKRWLSSYAERNFPNAQKNWDDIHYLNDDDVDHYLYAGLLFIQLNQRSVAIHYLTLFLKLSTVEHGATKLLLADLENQEKSAKSYDHSDLFLLENIARESILYSIKGSKAFSSHYHDISPLYPTGDLTTSKKAPIIDYLVRALKARNVHQLRGFAEMQWVLVERIARLLQTYIKSKDKNNRNLKFMVTTKDLQRNGNEAFKRGVDRAISESLEAMRVVESKRDSLKSSSQDIDFSELKHLLLAVHKEQNIPVNTLDFIPNQKEMIINVFELKLADKKYDDVIQETAKMLLSDAKNRMVCYYQGRAYEGLNNLTAAIECYNHALNLSSQAFPECEERLPKLAASCSATFKAWASDHEEKGLFVEAISCYSESLRYIPEDSEAYLNRGHCNMHLENYNEAEIDFENTIRLKKPTYEILYVLALTKEKLHKYSEALAICDKAIALKKDEPTLYYLRATIKEGQENLEGAITDMEHAIKLNKGDYPEAIEALRKLKNTINQKSSQHAADLVEKRREEERKRQEDRLQPQKTAEKNQKASVKIEMTENQFKIELLNLENSLKLPNSNKSALNKAYQDLEKYAESFQSSRFYTSRGDFYFKSAEQILESLQKNVLLEKAEKDYAIAMQYDPFDSTIADKIKLIRFTKSELSSNLKGGPQFFQPETPQNIPPSLPTRKPELKERASSTVAVADLSPDDQARLAAKKEELRKKMGI